MKPPLIAVDVDGVLNCLGPLGEGPRQGWRDAGVELLGRRFRIRHNPDHGAKLLALAEETGAELTWCTTWEEHANEHIAPLVGLPELPFVPLAPGRAGMRFTEYRPPGKIKAIALRDYVITAEGQRPFVWFDDDADPSYLSLPAPWLLVQVDAMNGLQDKHLEAAREWLTGLEAAA